MSSFWKLHTHLPTENLHPGS